MCFSESVHSGHLNSLSVTKALTKGLTKGLTWAKKRNNYSKERDYQYQRAGPTIAKSLSNISKEWE